MILLPWYVTAADTVISLLRLDGLARHRISVTESIEPDGRIHDRFADG